MGRNEWRPLQVWGIDSRTKENSCLDQKVYTPAGNLSLKLFYLAVSQIGRRIDTHMSILIFIACQSGFDCGRYSLSMIVHSLTPYQTIVTHAECRLGGLPTLRHSLHIGATFCVIALILGKLRGAIPVRINAALCCKPLREFCAQRRRVWRTRA